MAESRVLRLAERFLAKTLKQPLEGNSLMGYAIDRVAAPRFRLSGAPAPCSPVR